MRTLLILLFLLPAIQTCAQQDSAFIRNIYNEALSRGHAYEDLRSLCKDVGARVTGSAEAAMAVVWGEHRMKSYGFDKVWLQEITVPHWERGTKESGWIRLPDGSMQKVSLLALGGSIGTGGLMEADIVEFASLDALKSLKSNSSVKGKIVFINQPMDAQQINTFSAYGGCWPVRGTGAVEAARLGAKAVLIRSLAMPVDEHPHTGSMHYEDSVPKIPAAALSTRDADRLSAILKQGSARFALEMDCRNFPDAISYNVIGEMKGTVHPEEIITFGGHLDSWDTGEGAHDDGAGIIHCLEALRILKTLGYHPRHTLRVVFFMNEENGNRGGTSYATLAAGNSGETHIAALESDRGGFAPRGFQCDGTAEQLAMIQSFETLLAPYDLHVFEKGYGGVDIGPLKKELKDIPLFGFVPDSQRYFDFHHAPSDVFENVNKRELELGCAAIASFLYLLDKALP